MVDMAESPARPDMGSRNNLVYGDGGRLGCRLMLAGLLLVLVVIAGCTYGDSGERAGASRSAVASEPAGGVQRPPVAGAVVQLSCNTSIAAEPALPAGYRLVLRGLAVPVVRVLEVHETGAAEPTNRLFAKWGLVVRAGVALDLQLKPGWADRARISWGSSAAPGVAVHVPACQPPSGKGRWLVFAGGTWVKQPACVPLIVRFRGQVVEVPLGVGVPCGP